MHQNPRRRLLLASALLLIPALPGCIVVPAGRRRGREVAYETVTVEPPIPRVEIVGVAPGPGYLWIGGHWGWGGGRYNWAPGRWEGARPGYRWQPHRWMREGRGWREAPGQWVR